MREKTRLLHLLLENLDRDGRLWPITGNFRERAFLLAVLQMQMYMHVPSDGESLIQWQKILQKELLLQHWQQHSKAIQKKEA